jgi:hypothetical protein
MVNKHGAQLQAVYEAAKTHAQRSKSGAPTDANAAPLTVAPELTSELLHCLSTLPDPWPLAKITINMESASQWVSKMCRLFYAEEYARLSHGHSAQQAIDSALQTAKTVLPKLETCVIEFLSEWLVALLVPARNALKSRSPHLSFMLIKDYWFRELYLSLKVTASIERSESYVRVIDGQVRCITPDFKPKDLPVAWNVQFINVFIPAWMVPPIYHSLRRESVKNAASKQVMGVKSVRPTWFEDPTVPKGPVTDSLPGPPEPMHGLRLMIREDASPLREQPSFPALKELAKRGMLAPETWNCKRAQINLKASIDVPMLGTVIEQNGDGLLEEAYMPTGWPLHIDGAVRQRCVHKDSTLYELDTLLGEYDMKRALVVVNDNAPQWSHRAVWNKWYMEPKPGLSLLDLWTESEPTISQKSSRSSEVKDEDIRRVASVVSNYPTPAMPERPFLYALGTPGVQSVSPQVSSLALRAKEDWERSIYENKAVAILNQMQAGKKALIKKDGGEMLIAIVLDRPLEDAQALVQDADAFMRAITQIMQSKHNHPVIAQMLNPDVRDDLPPSACASGSSSRARPSDPPQTQFQ